MITISNAELISIILMFAVPLGTYGYIMGTKVKANHRFRDGWHAGFSTCRQQTIAMIGDPIKYLENCYQFKIYERDTHGD